MTFRKSILLLISLMMIAALVACSSSSSTPPPPPPKTGPLPDGNYVFSVAGYDNFGEDGSQYYVAGSITISGGAITGGEQDWVDFINGPLMDTITAAGSSITASSDGNLIIVLATADTLIGVDGVETFSGTILPASTTSRTFITEFDASASGSGELDTQDITGAGAATPSAGYAFVVGGYDSATGGTGNGGCNEAIGGIINVDNLAATGSISGTGSVFDANDCFSGYTFAGETIANTSVVSAPDASGRVTFTLDATDSADFPEMILAGYIVDSGHIRIVETADTYEGVLGGVALSQGANTGTFVSNAALVPGTYVTGLVGWDNEGALQLVNQLTLTAGTPNVVVGFADFNDLVNTSNAVSPDPVAGNAYVVDAAGAGDITIGDINDDGNSGTTVGGGYNLQVYLDGNGNALAITMDETDAIGGFGGEQTGAGGFTAASFSGAYGLNVTGWDANYVGEFDAVGPITADGVGTTTGTADVNWVYSAGPTYPDQTVTGTFVATGAGADAGILSQGTITGLDMTTCPTFTTGAAGCTADVFSYYLLDATGDNIAIETDTNQVSLGISEQQ
jgi:hypothetical protein